MEDGTAPISARHPGLVRGGGGPGSPTVWCCRLLTVWPAGGPVDPPCQLPRHINHPLHPNRPPTSHTSRYWMPDVVDGFRYLKAKTDRSAHVKISLGTGRSPACRGGPRPPRSLVAVRRPGQGIFRHFSGLVSFERAASVASPREFFFLSGWHWDPLWGGRLPRDHSYSGIPRACHRRDMKASHFFGSSIFHPRDG